MSLMIVEKLEDFKSIKRNDIVELVSDIDCTGVEISELIGYFNGDFNGNGHTISNLTLTKEIWGDEQKIALFKSISHASISNVKFDKIAINVDCGIYNPSIAALAVDVSDSIIKNIKINVISDMKGLIPMIYESTNSEIDEIVYELNGNKGKLIKYKDGNAV